MSYAHLSKQFAAYTNTSHYTSSKTTQVVMLYDGMIRLLSQVKEAIKNGDLQLRYNNLTKITSVLTGLQASLDFKEGGQVAKALDEFYYKIDRDISYLHQSTTPEECDFILHELKMMRDAWQAVDTETSGSALSTTSTSHSAGTPLPAPKVENNNPLHVSA